MKILSTSNQSFGAARYHFVPGTIGSNPFKTLGSKRIKDELFFLPKNITLVISKSKNPLLRKVRLRLHGENGTQTLFEVVAPPEKISTGRVIYVIRQGMKKIWRQQLEEIDYADMYPQLKASSFLQRKA